MLEGCEQRLQIREFLTEAVETGLLRCLMRLQKDETVPVDALPDCVEDLFLARAAFLSQSD